MQRYKPIKIEIDFDGKHYIGTAKPVKHSFVQGMPHVLQVVLQNRRIGFIHCEDDGWKMREKINPDLVRAIGEAIDAWYGRVAARRRMREFSKTLYG
jgi:hypothetical protein